jgi:hypothetical protein
LPPRLRQYPEIDEPTARKGVEVTEVIARFEKHGWFLRASLEG